jgi:DNA-binding HxlR family transcriptional regulator
LDSGVTTMSNTDRIICPKIAKAMKVLSKRWTILIINQLMQGTMRFHELEKSIPELSGKVLSARLKEMELDGLILRISYRELPPRVEYSLTPMARDLTPVIETLTTWADLYMNEDDNQKSG